MQINKLHVFHIVAVFLLLYLSSSPNKLSKEKDLDSLDVSNNH